MVFKRPFVAFSYFLIFFARNLIAIAEAPTVRCAATAACETAEVWLKMAPSYRPETCMATDQSKKWFYVLFMVPYGSWMAIFKGVSTTWLFGEH